MPNERIITNIAVHFPSTREASDKKGREIAAGMKTWWRGINEKPRAAKHDKRTQRQRDFDAGISAASEFVRRYVGYDERISLAMRALTFYARLEQKEAE